MRPERWGVLAVLVLAATMVAGLVGAGTFAIDHCMLVFFGYWTTRGIFRQGGLVTWCRPKPFWRVIFVALAPLSIFSIWYGGVVTYWRLAPAGSVYFDLIPLSAIGMTDGNDFMWNGFLLPLIGHRIVPLNLIPTSGAFTAWGIFLWLSQPIAFGWAVLKGNADAYFVYAMTRRQRVTATLTMLAIGLAISGVVIGITRLLVCFSQ
jgi:hypothetical protein